MAMILVSGEMLRIWRSSSRLCGRHRRLARGSQIKQHHIRLGAAHQRQHLFGGLGGRDVEIREDRLELAPQRAVVLEDE